MDVAEWKLLKEQHVPIKLFFFISDLKIISIILIF